MVKKADPLADILADFSKIKGENPIVSIFLLNFAAKSN